MQPIGSFVEDVRCELVSGGVHEEDTDAPFAHGVAFDAGVFVAVRHETRVSYV